jgi:hypothetical protein
MYSQFSRVGLLLVVLILAGCTIPENSGERQIAAEFGGSTAIAGRYQNDGAMIMDGTKLATDLYTKFGQQPKGVFFKPNDTVDFTMADDHTIVVAWTRGTDVIASVRFEKDKDYTVAANKLVFKVRHMEGGGLAGTSQLDVACSPDKELKILRTEATGPNLGPWSPLSRRFVDIMTFKPAPAAK